IAAGKIGVGLRTRLWGSEANLCSQLATGDSFRLKALAGFRYLELSERLDIDEGTLLTLANPVGALGGATVFSSDEFACRNYFHGGQIGGEGEVGLGPVFVRVRSTVAFGASHEVVTIAGRTTFTSNTGFVASVPSGVLALPSNSGRFSHDTF